MVGQHKKQILLLIFILISGIVTAQEYLKVRAKQGDGISVLLNRYNLAAYSCNVDTFLAINNLQRNDQLQLAKTYKLPIRVYEYNNQSIRTTINVNDYELAVLIQKFNETLSEDGIREFDYRVDKSLWVPIHALYCSTGKEVKSEVKILKSSETKAVDNSDPNLTDHKENTEQETTVALRTENFPIFGEKYAKTPIYTNKLKGQIYYLISGHGGPDPGAVGSKDGHIICEDEYAYDITLRFARNLLQHGATVYVITRDEDGIRDEEFLDNDKDETVWFNQDIPLNQSRRLSQRSSKINELYDKHKKEGATIQRCVEIHIDSRYEEQKVDIFVYYYPGSDLGKDLAIEMFRTIKSKYEEHQPGRGYKGVVRSRDLHTLRETKPPVVYIELGNITNEFDQKRLLIVNNRQAIANWLTSGVITKNGG
jgi:N-acetylmuramoyl-L-alanine amidase